MPHSDELDFDLDNRLIGAGYAAEDDGIELSLRPRTLDEYIGQDKVKENLCVFMQAAKKRGEPLDHVLLYGPPGLGKTTLANIIANEMGGNMRVTSGPAIEKPGDLAALLTNLEFNDVLFIDEIHRLSRAVEEVLYSALEDYALDIILGKGPSARSIRLDLAHFTLIGATTRYGQLSGPLRDRLSVPLKLDLYSVEDLARIVTRSAGVWGCPLSPTGRWKSPRARAGRRAWQTGAAQARARLLRRWRGTASSPRAWRGAPFPASRWMNWGLTASTSGC